MKISETINMAGGNLARPTKYNIILTPPSEILTETEPKNFDVLGKTINLPETINESIELMVKGHKVTIPGRTNQQQEVAITFYLDEFHQLRQVFYDWVSALDKRFYAPKNERTEHLLSKDDNLSFYGDMTLIARDFAETSNKPMSYKFEKIYPTNVGGLDFSTSGTNEVMEFAVTFSFYRFYHISVNIDNIDNYDSFLNSF